MKPRLHLLLLPLLASCAADTPRRHSTASATPAPRFSDTARYYRDPASGYTPILERDVGFDQLRKPAEDSARPLEKPVARKR